MDVRTLTRLAVTLPPLRDNGPHFSDSSKLTFFICFDDNLSDFCFLPALLFEVVSDKKTAEVDSCFRLLRMYELHAPTESFEGRLEFIGEGSDVRDE